MSDHLVGGWTVHDPVGPAEKAVFEKVLHGHVGVSYKPVAVATQIINGENYIFIAISTATTHPPKVGLAKIYITVSPAGSEPRLIHIENIV